ncbi:hypothetical protein [Campylobacter concisus]|uniref:hypothetical protein n=1 Tax=Campylobacter concisus TaxID=199 RepID=UPI0018FF18D7|nr:hypothetical protein [Campylobacter concisus]
MTILLKGFIPKISSRRHFLATTALLAVSAILPTFAHTSPTKGQNQTNLKKMIKNIVLVHGTFVDGSCYAELIRHLQEAGINAVAVQKAPMKGLSPEANGEIILPVKPRFSSASNAYECSCI